MTAIDDLAVILRFLFAKAIDERWRAVRVKRAEAELVERIRALSNVRTFLPERISSSAISQKRLQLSHSSAS
jgi:hypothetical protein